MSISVKTAEECRPVFCVFSGDFLPFSKMVILNTSMSVNKRLFIKEAEYKLNNQNTLICFQTILMDIQLIHLLSFGTK